MLCQSQLYYLDGEERPSYNNIAFSQNFSLAETTKSLNDQWSEHLKNNFTCPIKYKVFPPSDKKLWRSVQAAEVTRLSML